MDGVTPGSLAARILGYMRTSGGEISVEELAEGLECDEHEIRQAVGALRKACLLTTRLDERKPIYRLSGTKPQTIPGSALQVILARSAKAAEPPPLPQKTPAPQETETRMPKPPQPRRSTQDEIMAFFRANPGGHKANAICEAIGRSKRAGQQALTKLRRAGTLVRKPPMLWFLAVDIPEPVEAEPKPKRALKGARTGATNLAHFGAMVQRPAASRKIAYAIDSRGTVAIEHLRMSPLEIAEFVDFLEKTQLIWKAAQP
ncbi:MAG: hypothetical protein IPM64_17705 [Phycisphaerales bacterium]|nr:hypothetical protein [Phycisphaerales bacterium]